MKQLQMIIIQGNTEFRLFWYLIVDIAFLIQLMLSPSHSEFNGCVD